jgi:DTW domain-containing protein
LDKSPHAKRLLCRNCQRAQSACICHWIRPTASAVEVLILQHPLEVHHAKGSARLLHMSLPNSRIEVGESFAATRLQELLNSTWLTNTPAQSQKQAILLYPELPQDALKPELADPAQLRLVVIDGSWRKSRKMLYLNPLLQSLPRLCLDAVPASKYHIRKAHRPDQLSTFESTCAALLQLEGSNNLACRSGDTANKFAALMAGFEGFVEQQMAH